MTDERAEGEVVQEGPEERRGGGGHGGGMLVAVMAGIVAVAAITYLFLAQGGLRQNVDAVRKDVGSLQTEVWGKDGTGGGLKSRMNRAEKNIGALRVDLDAIEERLNRYARRNTARVGAIEDTQGVDHNRKLVVIPGFATGSDELTPSMKKGLGDRVVELVRGGWKINIVVGFADNRPYMKDGVDKNPELSLMRARNTASHLAGELGVTVPSDGRGSTAKFGGEDVNRSVLIYLERGK